ncbi:MAG: OmpH family outer membrane protein [Bacteroidales bacterium]|nr:OmpH family outer membrane protein [Bacteroidales bacterium]
MEEYNIQQPVPETTQVETKKCKLTKCHIVRLVLDAVMVIAIIVLFILHFCQPKADPYIPSVPEGQAGTGEILYVNIDSINQHYELIKILKDELEAEQIKQDAIFTNREKAFQTKLNNFQQNQQAGVLTAVQIQNSQAQLENEYQQIMADKERVMNDLMAKQSAANDQMLDSMLTVIRRINSVRNASFVFTYGYGSQMVLGDPTKDITNDVLKELNKSFLKK